VTSTAAADPSADPSADSGADSSAGSGAGSGADLDAGPEESPWPTIIRWALVGTFLVVMLVMADFQGGGGKPLGLIQPGADGPSIGAIREDFPDADPPEGFGLDGQQFYAIARDPGHPDDVAEHLDRPRYRMQRPVFPLLGWALHPTGGGTGLILALFAVGVAGILLGALATGALSVSLGGPAKLAVAFPLLPGSMVALRFTVADSLALALAVTALALAERGRWRWAVAVAVLAVLTKEPMILVFAGWWLGQRSRRTALLVAVPGCIAAAWALALRLSLPAGTAISPPEITLPPLRGLYLAVADRWLGEHEWLGMATAVAAVALGLAVLIGRRPANRMWWPVVVHLGFATVLGADVIGLNFAATRSMQPLLLLALLGLFSSRRSPTVDRADLALASPSPDAVHRPAPATVLQRLR
jgi:hypothetical protein